MIVLLFLITTNILFTLENDFSNVVGETFSGKILLNNSKTIVSENITVGTNFIYFQANKPSLDSIELDEVRILRIKYGNYAFEGSLLGALFGTSALILIDLYEGNGLNAPPESFATFVGIGAGLGLITGLFYSKQITIYKKGQMQLSILNHSIGNYYLNPGINLIKITYKL